MSYEPVRDPSSESKGRSVSPHLVIGLVLVVALLIFIFQNTEEVEVDFLFFDFSSPLWLVLLIVAILGGLLDGVIINAIRRMRGKEPKRRS
jgi:uncharacterized integral membrane protein